MKERSLRRVGNQRDSWRIHVFDFRWKKGNRRKANNRKASGAEKRFSVIRMSNLVHKQHTNHPSSCFSVCQVAPSAAVTGSHTTSKLLKNCLLLLCDSCLTLVAGMQLEWFFWCYHTPLWFLLSIIFMAKSPDDSSGHSTHQHASLQWLLSAKPTSHMPAFKRPGRVPRLGVITSELFQES